MIYLLVIAVKSFFGLIFTLLCLFTLKHFKAVRKVKEYVAQGMTAVPGFEKFPAGNASALMQYRNLREANKGKLTKKSSITRFCRQSETFQILIPILYRQETNADCNLLDQ